MTMVKINQIAEAFQAGKFPEKPTTSSEFQQSYSKLLGKATKLADVRKDYALYRYDNKFMLVKSDGNIVGMLTLENAKIAGKDYLDVAIVFVPVQYRKGPALYWLLYAVKEQVTKDVIADGAIFDDGQALVDAIKKNGMFHVFDLNKETGEITEVNKPISSMDHCYLFKTTNMGFGQQMFTEGMEFTWYPLFGEIGEEK